MMKFLQLKIAKQEFEVLEINQNLSLNFQKAKTEIRFEVFLNFSFTQKCGKLVVKRRSQKASFAGLQGSWFNFFFIQLVNLVREPQIESEQLRAACLMARLFTI